MTLNHTKVSNPLTLIAIFASLSELMATGVLIKLTGEVQITFVWFVMFFPILLIILFFLTMNFNHKVLYAPSDFSDEKNFIALAGAYSTQASEINLVQNLRKSDGKFDPTYKKLIRDWMNKNGLNNVSITFFMRSAIYSEPKERALKDLNII